MSAYLHGLSPDQDQTCTQEFRVEEMEKGGSRGKVEEVKEVEEGRGVVGGNDETYRTLLTR